MVVRVKKKKEKGGSFLQYDWNIEITAHLNFPVSEQL